MLTVVPGESSGHDDGKGGGSPSLIDEIVREGARRMLAEALQAEVDAYIAAHAAERDENGRRLVIAVADDQAAAIRVPLGGVHGDIGIDLGLQRLGQHPPGAFADDLIDQRQRAILPGLMA